MTGTRWTAVIILCILAMATLAQRPPGGERMMERFGDELKLTPEQSKKLEDLRYEMEKSSIDLRAELEKSRLELERLQSAEKVDRKAILKQAEAVVAIEGKLKMAKISHMVDVAEVLSPEQRRMIKDRGPNRGEGPMRERPEGRSGEHCPMKGQAPPEME